MTRPSETWFWLLRPQCRTCLAWPESGWKAGLQNQFSWSFLGSPDCRWWDRFGSAIYSFSAREKDIFPRKGSTSRRRWWHSGDTVLTSWTLSKTSLAPPIIFCGRGVWARWRWWRRRWRCRWPYRSFANGWFRRRVWDACLVGSCKRSRFALRRWCWIRWIFLVPSAGVCPV